MWIHEVSKAVKSLAHAPEEVEFIFRAPSGEFRNLKSLGFEECDSKDVSVRSGSCQGTANSIVGSLSTLSQDHRRDISFS